MARAEAEIAQANKRADWSAELMYSQRGPAYSNMVSLNFSIPWQLDRKNRQDRELAAQAGAGRSVAGAARRSRARTLADVRTWLQQWQSNRDRLARYDSSLIPLAAERTRAALAAYRGGGSPLTTVLEARRMEIDTRLERVRLEMENAGVWAQLEYLVPTARTRQPRERRTAMNRKAPLMGLIAVAVLGAAGYGLVLARHAARHGHGCAERCRSAQHAAPETAPQSIAQGEEATRRHIAAGLKAGDIDPATGKKMLYYHDPMVPGTKFDKPAKSPFMDMMLVPVYADSDADASKVTVSPRIQQNLGVRTARRHRRHAGAAASAVGSIAYNERDQAVVQARATGFVERLARARDARSRGEGPAAGRALRARLGRGAGGIPLGAAHARHRAGGAASTARANACGWPA